MKRLFPSARITHERVSRIACPRRRTSAGLGLAVLLAAILVLGACGRTEEAATNLTPIAPDVPEQDLAEVPQGLEEARLTIDGGTFSVGELVVQQNQPTILRVVNHDGQAYQLQIIPNLVDPIAIAAATTTQIEFTDPDAGTYDAQLLDSDTGRVVATLPVEVEAPAGDP